MDGKDNTALLFAACLILGVFIVGGYMGYQSGQPMFDAASHQPANIIGFLTGGVSFLFGIMTFQIGDVPAWLSLFYDMIITLCVAVPAFRLVRGSAG